MLVDETQEKHPRSRWADIRPVLFSRTVLFSTLAAFASYRALALYLSWNPVYLVTVRHLKLSDPLYFAGITLPYVAGGIALLCLARSLIASSARQGASVDPTCILLQLYSCERSVPVPFSERSLSVWLRHLFHARTHRGLHPYFVDHHHNSNTDSTPRCYSGDIRGSINTPRSHCSIGYRVDHPGGRKGHGVWIVPCVPASKPVTFDKWDRFPCMYEAQRRTTHTEKVSRGAAHVQS